MLIDKSALTEIEREALQLLVAEGQLDDVDLSDGERQVAVFALARIGGDAVRRQIAADGGEPREATDLRVRRAVTEVDRA